MEIAFLNLLNGDKATTRSLVKVISTAVDSGMLLPGDRLPSTRDISMVAGTSRTTVVRAYDELVARGYLDARKGAGTIVSFTATSQAHNRYSALKRQDDFCWTDKYSEIAKRLIAPSVQIATSADFDQLHYGAVPGEFLPTRQWRKQFSTSCRAQHELNVKEAADVFGYTKLRVAAAKFLRRTQGIICNPEQIVLYSGPQAALTHLMDLMVLAGQKAICENPGYAGVREQFRIRGAEVITIAIDREGMNTDRLMSISEPVQWLHVSPSCHDPTGANLSQRRRQQLLEWCQSRQTAIIEDAWDSEFQYASQSPPSLFSQDSMGAVIYLYNFWRLLFPLCSVGLLVLPERLIPLFRSSKYLNDRQFPTIEHHILAQLIEDGTLEQHLRAVWKTLRKRRQSVIFELKSCLTDSVEVMPNSAGMHAVIRLKGGWSKDKVLAAARAAMLPMISTEPYYADQSPEAEFMLHFASVPTLRAPYLIEDFVSRLRS